MSAEKSGTSVVSCPRCRRYYRVPRSAAGRSLRCTACGHVFRPGTGTPPPPPPEGSRVLVASDGEELQGLIQEVLLNGGFAPRTTASGDEALDIIRQWQPAAAVLDVSIPGMPVFEICDRVRSDPRHEGLGIILLASVYQHTRYKRSPTSLYGADDYIEKHHLRDSLVGKIERLVPGGGKSLSGETGRYPPPVREEQSLRGKVLPGREEMQREEETMVQEERFGSADREGPPSESLRRFARIIVADIALYNQELVEQGIREGTFHQLLAKEIAEGRQLFETRLTAGGARGRDLYRAAVEDFVEKQRARFLGESAQ